MMKRLLQVLLVIVWLASYFAVWALGTDYGYDTAEREAHCRITEQGCAP